MKSGTVFIFKYTAVGQLHSVLYIAQHTLAPSLVDLNIPQVVGSGFALPDHDGEHALLHPAAKHFSVRQDAPPVKQVLSRPHRNHHLSSHQSSASLHQSIMLERRHSVIWCRQS